MPRPCSCHGLPFWSLPSVPGWIVAGAASASRATARIGSARRSASLRTGHHRDAGGWGATGRVVRGDGEGVRGTGGEPVEDAVVEMAAAGEYQDRPAGDPDGLTGTADRVGDDRAAA